MLSQQVRALNDCEGGCPWKRWRRNRDERVGDSACLNGSLSRNSGPRWRSNLQDGGIFHVVEIVLFRYFRSAAYGGAHMKRTCAHDSDRLVRFMIRPEQNTSDIYTINSTQSTTEQDRKYSDSCDKLTSGRF